MIALETRSPAANRADYQLPETLPMATLLPFRANPAESLVLQIATYLRIVLEQVDNDEKSAVFPSPFELAVNLHCTVFDILDSLNELDRQGYHHELHAIDAPFLLQDALHCQPTQKDTTDATTIKGTHLDVWKLWLSRQLH